MLNRISLLLLVAAGGCGAAPGQSVDLEAIEEDVVYLASDLLEGRATGTPGEIKASEYIASRFEEIGLEPLGDDGGWFQAFSFTSRSNPHGMTGTLTSGRNVVGFLDREGTQTVVVGAHFDHLGWGGSGSRSPGDSAIHNGADDNASGVAAMIEIARRLGSDSDGQDVLFVAFSGEEHGLHGSDHYADNPTVDLELVNYMVNLDMVGRLKADRSLIVGGAGTSPTWIPLLGELGRGRFHMKFDSSGIGPSDHTSFYLKDKPVLHFFTGQHREYHRPSDDSELINYEGIGDIVDLVVDIVERTDAEPALSFTRTIDRSRGRRAAQFKVSLGVMPDYGWDGSGMRVDAVLDGRPAARAGIENGDVIIKIGSKDVADIYAYMDALSVYSEGDETTVVVKRGADELERRVRF